MSTTTPKTPISKEIHAVLKESHVSLQSSDGAHIKDVSWPNFASEIMKHVKVEDNNGKKMRTPFGTIFMQFNINRATIVIYHPAHVHKYTLVGRDGKNREYNIPLPNIVSEIELSSRDKNFYISSAKLYATNIAADVLASRYSRGFSFRSGTGDMRGGTFNIPLTNMYENGTICFGGNALPSIINEVDLVPCNRPYEILVDSPGNHDLGIRGVRGGSEFSSKIGDNYYNFFKYWESLPAFPYDQMEEY